MNLADADNTPMRVRSVRCHTHAAPLLRPFVTAARRTVAVEYVVVDVELEADGQTQTGQGSAAETVRVTGESAATIRDAVDGPLRAALEGAGGTIAELSALVASALPGATSAKEAADVALHDGWGKLADAPLAALLSGDPTLLGGEPGALAAGASMANDMTVSLESPEAMARHAAEAAADGYRMLKIKLGTDAVADRRRLDAVVAAAPGARLRLDANQGWTVDQAVRMLTRMEGDGLPVDVVEQPVAKGDLAGMRAVRRAVATPIMADESVWSLDDARRVLDAGAADMINIKLAKTGGIGQAIAIADAAGQAGVSCAIGSMMEPRISIVAAAHLAIAHPAVTMVDLDSPAWFGSDLPAGGIALDGGRLTLLPGPGLGLEMLGPDVDPLGPDGMAAGGKSAGDQGRRV